MCVLIYNRGCARSRGHRYRFTYIWDMVLLRESQPYFPEHFPKPTGTDWKI